MKVFRDIFAAMMIGVMGGLLVSTISYYNQHKEAGITHTLLAVADSFDTVAKAYSSGDENTLTVWNMKDSVLQAFEKVEEGEEASLSGAFLNAILSDDSVENDILAMDGEDGGIDEGAPYSGILRFHVRANSDSDEDQALKMAVKEDVITLLKPLLEECKNVEESKVVIVSNLQSIYASAINTITEQGYDYNVKVYVTEEEFPAKTYGDLTFPDGNYQALRIDIGDAKGQNWWCVMYPPLCFIDDSTVIVPEEGKEVLKENLTPKEYEDLFAHSKVKGRSWIYDWITGN
ncbi:MAG: stage II sporulation protein R [Lachnospiraceae bacterium]|nr:stage II sporulation protein R [Lachnospiraceae bacterium]